MVKSLFDVGLSALSDTFENMAFQEVLPIDDTVDPWSELDAVASSVQLKSPINAEITFIVPKDLAEQIIDDLYGFDAEHNDSVRKDTINELVNTIAGDLVHGLDKQCNFILGLPHFEETTFPAQGQTEDLLVYQINQAPCALKLQGDFASLEK